MTEKEKETQLWSERLAGMFAVTCQRFLTVSLKENFMSYQGPGIRQINKQANRLTCTLRPVGGTELWASY